MDAGMRPWGVQRSCGRRATDSAHVVKARSRGPEGEGRPKSARGHFSAGPVPAPLVWPARVPVYIFYIYPFSRRACMAYAHIYITALMATNMYSYSPDRAMASLRSRQ
jgi:hypothetical protein